MVILTFLVFLVLNMCPILYRDLCSIFHRKVLISSLFLIFCMFKSNERSEDSYIGLVIFFRIVLKSLEMCIHTY